MYSSASGSVAQVDTAIPAPLDNNQVVSSPDAYLITIPSTARPGEKFPVIIEGKQMMIMCPLDSGPGNMLRVAATVKMTVTLPTGSLGVFLKGKKRPKVSRLEPFSPLRDVLKPGMKIDSLTIPGDGKHESLDAARLGELLAESRDVPNRKLVVIKSVMNEGKPNRVQKEVSSSHLVAHGIVAGLEAFSFLG